MLTTFITSTFDVVELEKDNNYHEASIFFIVTMKKVCRDEIYVFTNSWQIYFYALRFIGTLSVELQKVLLCVSFKKQIYFFFQKI